MITLSIMLATIMQTLDSTIANVALPHMAGGLSASQDQITWVLTSYIVAAAIATPVTGWLSGRYGRKTIFLISIAGFTASSLLCGMSGNLLEIVGARLLQGVFGAALVPLSQAVMLDINPPERHARAMAVWGMGVMLGPVLGPTLGGWLTDNMTWRWVFLINLPVGILSFAGVYYYIHETGPKISKRFDWFGFSLLAIAIGMLQLLLDRGEQADWFGSIEIRVEAVCAFIAFTFFVLHTATDGSDSFFNVKLLKDQNFVTGLAFYFLLGLLLYATRALLPPLLQTLLGYPVMTTGLVTAPSGLGTMLAMMCAGRLVGRMDSRLIVALGFGLTALSLWQMAGYTPQITEWDVAWPGFIQGMGIGFTSVPLTTMTFSTLDKRLRPEGTAIYSLSRNIGSSIGISVMQTMLVRNTVIMHSSLAAYVTAGTLMSRPDPLSGFFDMSTSVGRAGLDAVLQNQASFIAYLDDFRLMFWVTLASIPFLLLMRTKKAVSEDSVEQAAETVAVGAE
ncbi:DHA2 family efflux MFS transporter permease subunit [Paralcaligenes sp. KSB-10]|uniref:DHA2 family efflux MFS transporter permease subunit n=1 Tax=Paralcaligenes sp. KSB-10 TaxID=2901142 RepID=UPI001E436F76|nr:DHA2 family efflux MFS transporter permease subunit [Paralcaligenes sp. KSB-10]UHL66426.1 DHA2 family efflux MFS transporter permease subunit [Paralcaligenes sp. KSB-10]